MSRRQGTAAIILLSAILLVQLIGPDVIAQNLISWELIVEKVGPAAASYLITVMAWTAAAVAAVLVAAISIVAILVWWNVRQVGRHS